jgi:hypothetical protein
MSNIIDFLERMGQDAQLRHAPQDEVEQALIRAQIEPAMRAAILGEDSRHLEALLGATANVCCGLVPLQDDESESTDESEDDKNDEPPAQQLASHRFAAAM